MRALRDFKAFEFTYRKGDHVPDAVFERIKPSSQRAMLNRHVCRDADAGERLATEVRGGVPAPEHALQQKMGRETITTRGRGRPKGSKNKPKGA